MSPAMAKAEAATRGAKADQSDAVAAKKATAKGKSDDAFGLVRPAIPARPPNAGLPLRNLALFSKQARAVVSLLFPARRPPDIPPRSRGETRAAVGGNHPLEECIGKVLERYPTGAECGGQDPHLLGERSDQTHFEVPKGRSTFVGLREPCRESSALGWLIRNGIVQTSKGVVKELGRDESRSNHAGSVAKTARRKG